MYCIPGVTHTITVVRDGIWSMVTSYPSPFLCRRAQLRDCLEVLRQHVPLPDKLTTLALLQSAKKYIEVCVGCVCGGGGGGGEQG